DSERKSSATQQREPTADVPAESPGLVQRCVVVQKDQLGFGFTVCGERVKLVQNVRPGGAAVKAGVQEGDRIIKVNGSLVSSMSHQEVVKLIKSGTYVALTLQGPPPSAASLPLEPLPTDLAPNQRTSLGGEAPPPPPPPLPSGLSSNPSQRITGPKPLQDPEVQKHATQILRKMLEQEEAELQDLMEQRLRNPSPSLEERIESAKRRAHQVRVKIQQDLVRRAGCLSSRLQSNCTDVIFSLLYHVVCLFYILLFPPSIQCFLFFSLLYSQMDGPFQDIELLKSRPAHMTVFMRYVFTQLLDPNPLVQSSLYSMLESRLHAQEDIRGPLSELQQQVLPDIQDQIQDYRNKQMMGLGSLFGEGDLQHLDGDPVKERQVVDRQVTALWEILGTKKEKDGEDKKRNPILKYIGKPRTTSQSSKYTHTHTHLCIKLEKEMKKVLILQVIGLVNLLDTDHRCLVMLNTFFISSSSELFTTEASHLRTLRVLDQVFFQKMRSVLNSDELACIFPNLPQVYELHASLCEAMKKRRETPIVQDIGDVMLARFEGGAGDEFQEQASQLCSQQSQALELIKNKQRKDPRFAHIIQECEASPHCRRLQLKDLLVSEMQRLTKYPLLLDNIIKHTEAGSSDLPSLQRAQACCRGILQTVNEVVRETEHRQRLSQYQRRLDAAPQFKSLDLTTKRMIHEGPLTWKVSKDKQIEIQALLLSDCLVLLQRGPDDRLQLRYPSRWLGGGGGSGGDSKTSFSPLVKLDSLLVRSVATDNKALYVISTTERQIYELVAGTSSEKNTWKDLLEKTVSSADGSSPLINHGSIPIP
uniref:Rho guanine nucleotide exchange factor (GEF) 11 n=1 Tax=Lates calcarifer TaxID=8187 RepID=A0A4W6EDH4_LATCA